MKTLRINRKRWLRGDSSLLWDESLNAGCCLGHACIQISKKKTSDISGEGCPSNIFKRHSWLTYRGGEYHIIRDNEFSRRAMDINDHPLHPDEQREALLIQLFKENGVKLEFYGEGRPQKAT